MAFVPAEEPGPGPLITRTVARSVAQRQAAYAEEIGRIVDAAYRVIERCGSLDPTVRDILAEAGISTQAFYRHFRSKDELLVALLDDGRRRLVGYLEHRMAKATTAEGQVRAWVEGVLAQAADPAAAARTKPFLANVDRLAARYPAEQQESVELLLALLSGAIERLATVGGLEPGPERLRSDAGAVYHLTMGVMQQHVRDGTRPGRAETDRLVGFCLAGLRRGQDVS